MTTEQLGRQENENKSRLIRIGLMGPVGAGKSTLAKLLGKRWKTNILTEDFGENPFLANFYTDPQEFNLKSQIWFLEAKIHQLKNHPGPIIDPALEMDALYAKTHKEIGWMSEDDWHLYENAYQELVQASNIQKPDVFILVNANSHTLFERIRERKRVYELNMLRETPEYFAKLSQAVDTWANEAERERIPIMRIDTGYYNFTKNKDYREETLRRVEAFVAVLFLQEGTGWELPKFKNE
jgi:deoxyadenosine/deoxycytidine kinase